MAKKERAFKGVWIPKEVWLDTRLSALDKIILAEIDSLDNGERGCFASNKNIADFCQCSEKKVSTAITALIEFGYLTIQSFDGRQRELRSNLAKNTILLGENCEADLQKVQDCIEESSNLPGKKVKAAWKKSKEINIDNNTVINTEIIKYIVEYLNSKIGASYKPTSRDTQKHIVARLREGYTTEDFKAVIDKQYAKWKGTEYEQYLRPSTLFGTKFEGYLNANAKPTKPQDNPADGGKGWNGTSGRTDF